MEDKWNEQKQNENFNVSSWFKTLSKKTLWILGGFLVIMAVTVGYLFKKNGFPSTKGIFTEYPPLIKDTILNQEDSLNVNTFLDDLSGPTEQIDSTLDDTDTLTVPFIETDLPNHTDSIATQPKSILENIFKVNTSYKKLSELPVFQEKQQVSTFEDIQKGLFFKLLINDEDNLELLNGMFDENVISYKSLITLLLIAGEDIILGDKNNLGTQIINVIAESENVDNIYIIDLEGNIVFTTLKPKVNTSIGNVMSNLSLDENRINIIEVEGIQHVSAPIYHTYGKIGLVVISIKSASVR